MLVVRKEGGKGVEKRKLRGLEVFYTTHEIQKQYKTDENTQIIIFGFLFDFFSHFFARAGWRSHGRSHHGEFFHGGLPIPGVANTTRITGNLILRGAFDACGVSAS